MLKLPLLVMILSIGTACSEVNDNALNDTLDGQNEPLANLYGRDTLTIAVQFSDCGEWGGHIERIDIYRVEKNLIAHYRRDTVNCPNPALFNRRVVEELTLPLSTKNQEEVMAFLKDVVEKSFDDEPPFHAGDHYTVSRSNGELNISYYNTSEAWTGFEELAQMIKATANNRTGQRP